MSKTKNADRLEQQMERAERFRRIAGFRANKALEYVERLLPTADKGRYFYSDKQTAEIVAKLRQAVDQLEATYAGSRSSKLRVEL